MKLKPMADNILLKAHEEKETTVSGIILATSNKEKPAIYEVVSVGPGTKDVTMTVSVGDKVVVGKFTGTDLTLDKDCVFIAVNSKDEEGMEGGMEGVQFANQGKVDSSKYIPNAIVVTDSDDDNNVLAVIYDANDIDWNDGLKDASNNPAEF